MKDNILSTSGKAFQRFISNLTEKLPKQQVRHRHSIMGVLVFREFFSHCINDRRKKATTYSKLPPYSQTAFKKGSSQVPLLLHCSPLWLKYPKKPFARRCLR